MTLRAADLFDLSGKVALVTGANSGIGREIALALADAGAAVVLMARRKDLLEETQAHIQALGGRASTLSCDLADRAALREAATQSAVAFGAPNILVNAAGINPRKPIADVTEADWDATMRINLDAPFFLTQALVPAMCQLGWGRVIHIASLQSLRAFTNGAPYGASKGAIMQLTRAHAQAWSAQGVNVNAIAPGFFPTALTAPVVNDPKKWQANADQTFIGRNGALEDLRGAAIFLASRASNYITGQTIFVDGGFSAG